MSSPRQRFSCEDNGVEFALSSLVNKNGAAFSFGPEGAPIAWMMIADCASSFQPMNTDIYCEVSIIILRVQRIRITSVLLYAIKYVNVFCQINGPNA